jgi:hypothetical protein
MSQAMSDPNSDRRKTQRRRTDRRTGERRGAKLPVAAAPAASDGGGSAFAAQLMGQEGVKRGLRGGPPVLEQARSAYLEAEWMGPSDRRSRPGRSAKTDV